MREPAAQIGPVTSAEVEAILKLPIHGSERRRIVERMLASAASVQQDKEILADVRAELDEKRALVSHLRSVTRVTRADAEALETFLSVAEAAERNPR